jgi:GNAT superfamily N-acetyltransferase
MKIDYLDTSEIDVLTNIYNDHFASVPHCHPVSSDEFVDGFPYHKCIRGSYHEDINSEKIIVGKQDGKIIGFADVALAKTQDNGQNDNIGFIRFLTYKAGYRTVGQAILEECERYLSSFDIKEIKAFRIKFVNDHCGYRFYHLAYNLISDKMGHICALLNMNGYEKTGGEIFLNQPVYKVVEPIPPDRKFEIILKQLIPEHAELPGIKVITLIDGKEVGECESQSAGEFCKAEMAQDWLFITGLWVEESLRKKGWGRYLLQRNLWEMQKTGYKNTVISTDWMNYRAQLFYSNYGYHLVDTGYEFTKKMQYR